MKKTSLISAILLLGAASVSAQYCPTEKGKTYEYTNTLTEGNKTFTSTDLVTDITAADGVTTVVVKSSIASENPLADDIVMNNMYTYPSDNVTTVYLTRGEDFRKMLLDVVKMQLEQAGQASSDNLKQLEDAFKVKGDLTLVLDPNAAAGAAIPNSRLRLDMGMQVATMFLSKGVVDGFESVTVPAGTFDKCIKVSYEYRSNSPEGTEKDFVTAWYANGVGLVKEVRADKKGNVTATQELVVIK